ncbi:unnamed protein product [Discula destructiva]
MAASPRQILPAKGVSRTISTSNYTVDAPAGVHSGSDDVVMTDAAAASPAKLQVASQLYQQVTPVVNPAVAVAANGLTRGVKRAADVSISKPFAVAAEAYVETKHSTDDGLVIKRFKRLPIASNRATSLAKLSNTLPVKELRQLPANQFCWTDDPMTHLGPKNHGRVRTWLRNVRYHMTSDQFSMFPHIDHTLYSRALPASVTKILRDAAQAPYLSVLLHNHMIAHYDRSDLGTFKESGFNFIAKLDHLLAVHEQTYHDGGRISSYELYRIKPTGPINIPYAELGIHAPTERSRLRECVEFVHFLLVARNDLNQNFPTETFAGILADLDAIRKDELPPSYVDWPGKAELHTPGRYPAHDMEQRLFDTISFADFTIDRMWDQWHPSPKKKVTAADQRTPVRKAMQKNALVKDRKGQMQPLKGALKTVKTNYKAIEERREREVTEDAEERIDIDMDANKVESRAAFIDSPVAWYMPSVNTPLRHGRSIRRPFLTPAQSILGHTVVEAAEIVEPLQECPPAADPVQAMVSPQIVQRVQIGGLTRHGDALLVNQDALPTDTDAPVVDEDALPAVTTPPRATEETHPPEANDVLIVEDTLFAVADATHMAEALPATEAIPAIPVVATASSVTEEAVSAANDTVSVAPMAVSTAVPRCDLRRNTYKTADELLDEDEDGPFGRPSYMRMSEEKEIDIALQVQLMQDAQFRVQQELNASARRQREEERKAREAEREVEEAKRRAREAERKAQEEERQRLEDEARVVEQARLREDDERIAQAGQLRQPHRDIVPNLADDWLQRAQATLTARANTELAKTPDGTPLLPKDFATVVEPHRWLNDEIVNGTLSHLNNYINQTAGIKNFRNQTPKSQLLNSFIGKRLVEGTINDRMMRRLGVKKENFLEIETLLIPVCSGSHWTLVVIRPKHRQIAHLDSLRSNGDPALIQKTTDFISSFLGDDFYEDEWTTMSARSPQQANSDDCGVHAITNGICVGLGIDPTYAYDTTMMKSQRLRIASVLLNGGFRGNFTLDGY